MILGILFSVVLLDTIFHTFFIDIFLVGVVFKLFLEAIHSKSYYILFMIITIFLFIETIYNLPLFLFTFISLFCYYIVIPKIKHIFSMNLLKEISYVAVFYGIFFIIYMINSHYNIKPLSIFVYNFIIDSLLVGFLI